MNRPVPRLPRSLAIVAASLLAAITLAACDVPDPEGAAPLRYRDQIFTDVKTTTGVQYGQAPLADGTQQKLLADVYQPVGDTSTSRPAIIWMHGGGFAAGSRQDAMMVELSKRFARRGYVAMSISYRLMAGSLCGGSASNACVLAALKAAEDERAAVRYLRAKAGELGVDPARIGIGGASAGAVTSLLAAASPNVAGESGNPGYSSVVGGVVSFSGGLPLNAVFPKTMAPVLFWHGTTDTVVPYDWAKTNAEFLNNQGTIGFAHFVQGAGHVPWSQYAEDMDRQARNFLFQAVANRPIVVPTTP